MKNFILKRTTFTKNSTIGELSFEGEFVAFTLEDVVRAAGVKLYGETAIPAGKYQLVITYSNAFKKPLPLLMNIPGFAGVRLHGGNTKADTLGCPLLAMEKGPDRVWNCAPAMKKVMAIIRKYEKTDKIYITVC